MSRKPRLRPQGPEAWSERTRQLLGGTVAPVGELEAAGDRPRGPLNILKTIAHHPHLLEPFLAFAATLAVRGTLPRRASELLALRTAWNCRSVFEWGHHVIYARAAGLSEAEIERADADSGHPDWSEGDRLLLIAADELHRDQDLSDSTWSALQSRWEEAQLLEIPFIVGNYTMLSMVANATGVPVEDGLPGLPGS